MLGIIPISEALALAKTRNLDLVEVSPISDPPVCKLLDFGKFKYEAKKKSQTAKKKQKVVEIKEIKLRPNIGEHDYEVKLKSIRKFIGEGNKVKITLKFKGREITHHEIGVQLLEKLQLDVQEISKVEFAPRMEGKQMLMIISPR